MVRTAAALSRTAEAALAAAEAADAAAVELAAPCDLAVVLVAAEHHGELAAVGLAVEARLEPGTLIGAVAQGVIGPGEEVESGPAVAVLAAHLGAGHVHPFRSWSMRAPDGGLAVAGWPDTRPGDTTLVLADPYSFPAAEVARRIGQQRPDQPLVGGMVTGGPDHTELLLDGEVHTDGAVGVVLRELAVSALVSQGCRPVGEPLTVTAAERNRVLTLGGERAADRLRELLASVEPGVRAQLQQGGLQLGLVVDEVRDDYDRGDFLVRGILGVDPDTGALAIADLPQLGQTAQFQLRDAGSAHHDLVERLAGLRVPPAGAPAGALLFTCNGRGRALFGRGDHDVQVVEHALKVPVIGAFCAGELGPVGSSSYLHSFTASLAVLHEAAVGDGPGGA